MRSAAADTGITIGRITRCSKSLLSRIRTRLTIPQWTAGDPAGAIHPWRGEDESAGTAGNQNRSKKNGASRAAGRA